MGVDEKKVNADKTAAGGRRIRFGVFVHRSAGASFLTCVFALVVYLFCGSCAEARFSFRAGLSTSAQWSDNVYSAPEDPEADISLSVTPSISLDYLGKQWTAFFNASATRRKYRRLKTLDRDSFSTSLDATYRYSRHTTFTFFHSLSYALDGTTQEQRYADVATEAGIVQQLVQKDIIADELVNEIRVGCSHKFSPRTEFSAWVYRRDKLYSEEGFDESHNTSAEMKLTRQVNRSDNYTVTL